MTTLYQLKPDRTVVDCGMSYVFQLASGHFFVIDGGFCTPGEADRLYRFLSERCGGRPVIAGWFFSHGHQDHVGCFLDFAEKYAADADILRVICHFQPMQLPASSEGWREVHRDPETVLRFYQVLEEIRVPVTVPVTGDETDIEELHLLFMTSPDELEEPYLFNDASVVLMVSACGQKILFPGDIQEKGSRLLLRWPAEMIRCDIMQVAHHGYPGAMKAVYEAAQAPVLLWPAPWDRLPEFAANEVDSYLLGEYGAKQILFDCFGTAAMVLPYRCGEEFGK